MFFYLKIIVRLMYDEKSVCLCDFTRNHGYYRVNFALHVEIMPEFRYSYD